MEKEIEDIPVLYVLQDHENRLTKQEEYQKNLHSEMKEIKTVINDGNKKAEEKLDQINGRLMDEFLLMKRSSHETKNKVIIKVIGSLVGGGSILYVIFDLLINRMGGL